MFPQEHWRSLITVSKTHSFFFHYFFIFFEQTLRRSDTCSKSDYFKYMFKNFSVFHCISHQFQQTSCCTLAYISSVLFNLSGSGFISSCMPFYVLCKAFSIAFCVKSSTWINPPRLQNVIKSLWSYKQHIGNWSFYIALCSADVKNEVWEKVWKEVRLLTPMGHHRLIVEAHDCEILSSVFGEKKKQFLIKNHSLKLEEILAPCI